MVRRSPLQNFSNEVIMLIKYTKEETRFTRILGYSGCGSGKTYSIKDLESPFIGSLENGLSPLSGQMIPYAEIDSLESMREVYKWLKNSPEAKQYKTFCLDSLTVLAGKVLEEELKGTKDGRMAYGNMATTVTGIVNGLCKLPIDLYCIAQLDRTQDELGKLLYSPSMPGKVLGQALPYIFDEVLALHVSKDTDGNITRAWQCQADGIWQAKDRSGKLAQWEKPNLQNIINKTKGVSCN
jgi:hypothetical protein